MNRDVGERSFEDAIEQALLAAPAVADASLRFGEGPPGGYQRRLAADYDPALCLLPKDVLAFVLATQPKEWERLSKQLGAEAKERFLKRVAGEVERRGVLDVLRKGVKDSGVHIRLAYFRPSSGLNEELRRLYLGNLFSVVRQVHYSERTPEKSLDVVLCLNGLPIFTAELKNPLTGQTVQDAIRQYRTDRDPRDPCLSFRRCLAHFAVDPDLVFVTTRLEGAATRFLPFNLGKYGGAGNPPAMKLYATSYLWERVWAKDSVLNLLQHFVHEFEEEDDEGKKTGQRRLVFPRYHQLDSVRRLVADAREKGAGQRYLIQHSAGSGKSNSIAWLAHQLSVLHDAKDLRVFDSIVVITDRRVLDRQLQRTVRQFEQTRGVVENIDKHSSQLREALEAGKTIIVSTLQKFPMIVDQIKDLPGKRFAVIIDEAHSSQTGESTKSLKEVLAAPSLEAAEKEEGGTGEDLEDRIVAEMKARGRLANVSTFAFTATPKEKTLELFGSPRPDGKFEAFSLYTMRQAIEEGFILDVLENYTTYKVYWSLLKKVAEDPRYDKVKASYLLRSFVDLHEHAIQKKIEIIAEHFSTNVAHRIGGRAKAMIVTRSRLHAVRYKLALDKHLKEKGHRFRALVAFSGTVKDGGVAYTEAGMNGFSETQTAKAFERPEYRLLVVANKFQTGFDQPLLHTMYVDKKLGGVNAVQTLSRLNRVHPGKEETVVLDFANEADEIQKAFEPYYERTLLSEATDPNLLYDLNRQILDFHVFSEAGVDAFARLYFAGEKRPNGRHAKLHGALKPVADRVAELPEAEREDLRGKIGDYVRLYAFLSQVVRFADAALEKFYVYTRLLLRLLPRRPQDLPREIQQLIDMDSYRVQKTGSGPIPLPRGEGEVEPRGPGGTRIPVEEVEPLSEIIRELNERFGTDFSDEDKVFIETLESRLAADETLNAALRANTRENARLTFDHVVESTLQGMVDTNFDFYKRVTDDREFSKFFLDWLFERFAKFAGDEP